MTNCNDNKPAITALQEKGESNLAFLERITHGESPAYNQATFECITCDIYGSLMEMCDLANFEAQGGFDGFDGGDDVPTVPDCDCLYCAMPTFRFNNPLRFPEFVAVDCEELF